MSFPNRTVLGRTGLEVSKMGLAAGYGVSAEATKRAFFEHGINYFYFETRKPGMRQGLSELIKNHRKELVIAIQSYDHVGWFLAESVKKALRALGTDHADILFLGYYNKMPRKGLIKTARKLMTKGVVGHLGITGHNRQFHGLLAAATDSPFNVQMVRYNAAHRGATTDVFPHLASEHQERPGICTYTATRWGQLTNPKKMPRGVAPLTGADCYRFVLSDPHVDTCLFGPRTDQEMEQGVCALAKGPLNEAEMNRARQIGDHLHR